MLVFRAMTERSDHLLVAIVPSEEDCIAACRSALLAHFERHGRDLPWRRSRDPYAIWVSEVMLQQTRVETVIPYYTRFLERFPTPRALADAPLESVLAAWAGLGYYRRARLLHAGARAVVAQHGGVLPGDVKALRALPGVGDYTAGAIASIAFGLPEPVVDGNVERVIARLFALRGDPRRAPTRARLWALARRFADCDRPGDVNQALMDLGATVCLPVHPRCLLCPVRRFCAAHAQGDPERYPERRPRIPVRRETWHALVAMDPSGTQVWLIPAEQGRWQGMLLPPMVQNARADWPGTLGVDDVVPAGSITHVLTHVSMEVEIHRGTLVVPPATGRMVSLTDFDGLAVPKITRAIVEHVRRRFEP